MNDDEMARARAELAPIVEGVVSDIANRRAVPWVFLLDESGELVVWPARAGKGSLPPTLGALVAMYFAQDRSSRQLLSEYIDVSGVPMVVRIIPHHAGDTTKYALVVERFSVRARLRRDPGEFSMAP
jgi:hypothetical protein